MNEGTLGLSKKETDGLSSGDVPLRLRAQDLEDLTVVGTMVQDALAPAGDMRLLKESRQFIMVLNRFRWEHAGDAASNADGSGAFSRTLSGLRFDTVMRAQFRGIDWQDPDRIMSLLTIAYDNTSSDEHEIVVLHFAGGAAIRLIVDSLQCALDDVGDPWPTQWKPGHEPD